MKTIQANKAHQLIDALKKTNIHAKIYVRPVDDDEPLISLAGVDIIDDDIYRNINDPEDCGTIDDLESVHGIGFDIDDYIVSIAKGSVILNIS